MIFYKLLSDPLTQKIYGATKIGADVTISFVFDPANTDYQQFKIQVADGTPLEDPDGNVMTQEQVDEFLRTIP